ncbi:MAG: hypothetical protein JXR19_07510 [Bacteroidia bacterium]
MFTDIVGFTAIMQQDESMAVAKVTRHENTIKKAANKYGGEVINFFGDGSLTIFQDLNSALKCAMEIQTELCNGDQVPLRIGLHMGEVLLQDGNIYGDSVNIASRIESLGQAGAILYSEDVYNNIQDSPEFKSQALGSFHFKNVKETMPIYALACEGFTVPSQIHMDAKLEKKNESEPEKSIVVLPFKNHSFTDSQYLIDGIADEIRSHLLSISELKVISRSSSMHYADSNYELSQIGKELDVMYALEGRVQVIGSHIKVNIDLSNTRNNKHIWSLAPGHQKVNDVFAFQSAMAKKVVSELRIAISDKEKIQLEKVPTHNEEAYSYYQKGLNLLHRGFGMITELDAAVECFKKAIALDKDFARAYVGLSDTYMEYIFWGRIAPKEVLDLALGAGLKALELDNTSGESYGTLGAISFGKCNKDDATNFLEKAIELSPNYLSAYEKLTWIKLYDGEIDDAIKLLSKAQSLDPLSTKYIGDMAHIYYYSNRCKEGLDYMIPHLMKDPENPWLLWSKGYLYSGMQDYEKAIKAFTSRLTSGKNTNWMLGYCYGMHGDTEEATSILEWHLDKRENEYVPAYMIACIYIGLDKQEEALNWLEKDYEEGGLGLFFWGLKSDPKFNKLHDHARYKQLLSKIN